MAISREDAVQVADRILEHMSRKAALDLLAEILELSKNQSYRDSVTMIAEHIVNSALDESEP